MDIDNNIERIRADVIGFIPAYKKLLENMTEIGAIGMTFGALGNVICEAITNNPAERHDILNASYEGFNYMMDQVQNDLANRMKASFNTIN